MQYFCRRCHDMFDLKQMVLIEEEKFDYYVCKPCKNKPAQPMPKMKEPL